MIELRHVTKTYPVGDGLTVLCDVSLSIGDNERVGILGASGSGKSTLLHIMGLLDRPTSGSVLFRGQDVSRLPDARMSEARGRWIGFVFQSFHLIPQFTLADNVALPLIYQHVPRRERRRRAHESLDAVGLSHRTEHLPGRVSGGECQRAAIARALVTNPGLILADEPTGNLDSRTGQGIIELFESLHAQGRTIIMITHDPQLAARMSRIVKIADGRIQEDTRS